MGMTRNVCNKNVGFMI